QRSGRFAVVPRQLAAYEIMGLYPVGPFVDRSNSSVAQILRSAGLLDIPHPAMHLNPGRSDRDPELGTPRLDPRDQQIRAALRGGALRRFGMAAPAVDRCGSVI